MLTCKKNYYLAMLIYPFLTAAQHTGSGINGTVKTKSGLILAGASIKIMHEPTATQYVTQTSKNGLFDMSDMSPGGPYTIEVSAIGFVTEKKMGIYLRLGESFLMDFNLADRAIYLGNVTVNSTAKSKQAFSVSGIDHIITADKTAILPSVGRTVQDQLRSVPQAKLMNGNEGAVSFAGQNNRFNAFYIDGAVSNDVFGLAASGTNGGQAGISPVPLDAVSQFQIALSPFDATLGNFTGAAINAVTRSGSNQTEGSVYYFFSNATLTGKTPTGPQAAALKPDGFSMQHFGARMQGAITKNKFFYFINIDLQRNNRPQPFDFGEYRGDTRNKQTVLILANALKANYGYDPGTWLDNAEMLRANRLVARFDWNLSKRKRIAFSYRYTNGEKINTNAGTANAVHFSNDGYTLLTDTHSFSFEMKSRNGKNNGNTFMATCTQVNDNRDPLGKPFPRVRINDGEGAFIFGTDNSSTINFLSQYNWTLTEKYHFFIGRHFVNMGIDLEYSKVFNAFIQNSFGNYTYASISDFLTGKQPSAYQTGFPLRDIVNGDHTASAADFATLKYACFVNDHFRLFKHFEMNIGIRIDEYRFLNKPATDDYTNQVALPRFETYWNLYVARSGLITRVPISLSPRLGFTFIPGRDYFVLSGGIGVFAGRIPLSWPGGAYQNNGLFIGGYTAGAGELNRIRFRPDPFKQWMPGELGVSGNKEPLNLTAAIFSMPKNARIWLSVGSHLDKNLQLTASSMLSKNLNEITYTNINLLPPVGNAVGPDNRFIYSVVNNARIPIEPNGANPFAYAILLSNNKSNTGYSYHHTWSVHYKNSSGFSAECHYHFGKSVILNDGTSSVNLSQWRFIETVNGRNYPTLSTSDFSSGRRIFLLLSRRFQNQSKKINTTISLSYTGESGSPFSYVYGGKSMTRDDGVYGGNDLVYIPSGSDLDKMVFVPFSNGNTSVTALQQKEALGRFIEGDAYLKKHQGNYAERNGNRTPFTHIIDLKINTEITIGLYGKKYRLQISYDVFNLANLLNRKFGRRYLQPNDNFALIQFAGYASENDYTPRYQFNPELLKNPPWIVSNSLSPAFTSRWMGQLGIRITFN